MNLSNGKACVVDAKGNDVHCGDTVVDSFANRHTVQSFDIINQDAAWIVDENKERLVPHLVECILAEPDDKSMMVCRTCKHFGFFNQKDSMEKFETCCFLNAEKGHFPFMPFADEVAMDDPACDAYQKRSA